jgi:hypothetical protein
LGLFDTGHALVVTQTRLLKRTAPRHSFQPPFTVGKRIQKTPNFFLYSPYQLTPIFIVPRWQLPMGSLQDVKKQCPDLHS